MGLYSVKSDALTVENKTVKLPCDVYKYNEAIEIPEMKTKRFKLKMNGIPIASVSRTWRKVL